MIARSEKKLEEIKKSHKTYIRIFAGDMEEDLVYKQVKNRLENQNPDIRMLVNEQDRKDRDSRGDCKGRQETSAPHDRPELPGTDRDDLYLSALDA